MYPTCRPACELLAKTGPEATRLNNALNHFLEVTPVSSPSPEVKVFTAKLDAGEQQAIALAYEQKTLLLMDEYRGRVAARRLGLVVTGVVGVLLRAKEAGMIPLVIPSLQEIRRQGYWLSDDLLEVAAKLAGE